MMVDIEITVMYGLNDNSQNIDKETSLNNFKKYIG